jgi:hypothetical protein
MIALVVVAAVLALLVLAELVARFGLGLGDPPLWLADPEMEYLPRPSASYVRFGNRIRYNAFSMRSRDFAATRADPAEARVLVAGDSVVNGGAEVDQEQLATTLLEKRLAEELGKPVVFGNVGAGSWGPPNCLAYLRRFGLFDADLVVLVFNSADWTDAPTYEPLTRRRPQRKPVLALQEIWDKYIPRMVRKRKRKLLGPKPFDQDAADTCMAALRDLVAMTRKAGSEVIVAQHLKRSELAGEPERGHDEIARVTKEQGVEPLTLGPAFAAALGRGDRPYHDDIHPSAAGQRVMAEALYEPILASLRRVEKG